MCNARATEKGVGDKKKVDNVSDIGAWERHPQAAAAEIKGKHSHHTRLPSGFPPIVDQRWEPEEGFSRL